MWAAVELIQIKTDGASKHQLFLRPSAFAPVAMTALEDEKCLMLWPSG
jgi:hypothetical protein